MKEFNKMGGGCETLGSFLDSKLGRLGLVLLRNEETEEGYHK